MKITASGTSIVSVHAAETRVETQESLRAWVGDRPPEDGARADAPAPATHVVLSPESMLASLADRLQAQVDAVRQREAPPAASAIEHAADAAEHDPRVRLLKLIIEMLTGHAVRTVRPEDLGDAAGQSQSDCVPADAGGAAPAAPPRAGFGIEYDAHTVREESESTQVAATGTVRTADGREIAFSVTLDMQRSYREESSVSLRAGDAVRRDPLVINLDATAAQLQPARFSFDLDGDGTKEQVPLPAGGSGYLALDLDGNGRIDSGRELFGTASGDGFADLARYDSDGNGWIDESDPVFSQLRVWQPAASGPGTLSTLAQHDVGALALARAASPFELRDAANASLGAVRSTGIYLHEDGSAGTLQQIDLSV